MTTNSRKQRGSESENWLAEYYKGRGWPYAEPTKQHGRDVTGMPGLAPEVKARYAFEPVAWLRQAERNADGDLPYVVFRPNGMGKAQIGRWGALLRNDDLTWLLRQAGFGDPLLPGTE